MDNIFSLIGVEKKYSDFHLKEINISCKKGVIMGLIGPNGAGKTTILDILAGAKQPSSGEVEIFGKKASRLTDTDKEHIGVVYDSNHLPELLSLKEINRVFKKIYKEGWSEEKYFYYTSKMNIPSKTSVKKMSRGNKIKLNLAAALAHNPDLLILDEITGALDPVARDDIMDIFLDFIQDPNKSILFSSHITTDLEKVADYITFLKDGEIIFSKEKDSLLYEYRILRCKASKFSDLDAKGVVAYKEGPGSYDVIWNKEKLPLVEGVEGVVIEQPTIEEIMLIITIV